MNLGVKIPKRKRGSITRKGEREKRSRERERKEGEEALPGKSEARDK